MEKTEWVFGEILIQEPMTALTDLIITTVCLIGFYKLYNLSRQNDGYMKNFAYFVLFMGLGTLFAAILTHAFDYVFNPEQLTKAEIKELNWKNKFQINLHNLPNWVFNVISTTLFEISVIQRAKYYLKNYNFSIIKWFVVIESTIISILLMYNLSYDIASIHIGIALFVVSMPLQVKIYKKYKAPDAKLLIIGSLIMLIVVPVMITKFEITKWFNFNDISHVVIATTMYLFYLAGLNFYDNKLNEELSAKRIH
ncbi:MAG: hypothetical protein IKQ46_16010 [Bacteroidales bacterium]|jgi:hypothetical protein|nr:hypothetical protein [Bacteroidales bacterium]